jgi:hypothetical protein
MSTRYDEDRENAKRDPRRNEAIFDGGCARFVPKEGHDFCHGQDMGIVGTVQKGPVLLGPPKPATAIFKPATRLGNRPVPTTSVLSELGHPQREIRTVKLDNFY